MQYFGILAGFMTGFKRELVLTLQRTQKPIALIYHRLKTNNNYGGFFNMYTVATNFKF